MNRRLIFPSWPIWLLIIVALGVAMLPLHGCTQDRWLTKEEDAELRANCEKTGCTMIQNPAWEQIKRALGLTDV